MTTGIFPADPSSRKAILVLQQHDVEKCSYEQAASQALLDDETYVLRFPVQSPDSSPLALRNILDAGLARPGAILVQSPFDPDTYEDALVAPHQFALAKHMYFSSLCRHLGATEVVVEQVDLKTSSGKSTLNLKGGCDGVSASVRIEGEELDRFRTQLQLRDEFAGGPPDVAAAENLLRRAHLWSDHNMRSLLDMRRDGANQLITRSLVLSLSNEAKSNLNVVGRLKVPAFVNLTADYRRVVQKQYDYTLTVSVRFGQNSN